MANTFNCPSCSAPLVTDGLESSIRCEYCGATVIVPSELRNPTASAGEDVPPPEPHPSQVDGPHGKLTSSQMRQMMAEIRDGRLENATKAFQEATGASQETAGQTVQMIANQISASNLILPTELAAIMRTFAESAGRSNEPLQPAREPQHRSGGMGCWLVLIIILVVFYFAYTSLSPISLGASLIAGNAGDPVMKTAVAPFHTIATAIATLIH